MRGTSMGTVAACVVIAAAGGGTRDLHPPTIAAGARLVSRPLVFEANAGQTDPSVRFVAKGGGCTAFLTPTRTVLPIARGALAIRAVGANPAPQMEGTDELPGKANYFLGKDPSKWRTGVATFARVRCRDVYPGIDVVWHGAGDRLEYDFDVAPGVDPSVIELAFDGAETIEVDDAGDLAIHAGGAVVRQRRPVVYEELDGVRREIEGGYEIDGTDRVRFRLAAHDPRAALCIDPQVYATYLGGTGDSGFERIFGMAKDADGDTYVCGGTTSADFPVVAGAFQSAYGGGGGFGRGDEFVSKFDPTGTTLLYSTYIGGSDDDEAYGIAVDASGAAYVGGNAYSTNFPTTAGAFSTVFGVSVDGVVSKLNPAGSALVYSTYVGGVGSGVFGIAIDGAGHAFGMGGAYGGFATTAGAAQTTNHGDSDAIVFELAPDGASMEYATYLGGGSFDRGIGIAVSASGEACVTGYTSSGDFPVSVPTPFQGTSGGGPYDAFVTRVAAGGGSFVFSTYLGGGGDDYASAPSLDAAGNLYAPGYTTSTDFPTVAPVQAGNGGGRDAFLVKFTPTGDVPLSTYFGGSSDEIGYATATRTDGAVWMTGYTQSTDFPVVNAEKPTIGGTADAFLARLNAAGGAFDRVTYVGGSGEDYGYAIALTAAGDPILGGQTSSTDLVTTSGAAQTTFGGGNEDAFLSTAPVPLVPTPIVSFFLPRTLRLSIDKKGSSAKDSLVGSGFFDDGGGVGIDYVSQPVTIRIGGWTRTITLVANKRRTKFKFKDDKLNFVLTPNLRKASLGLFTIRISKTALGALIDATKPVELHFTAVGVSDATATVRLTNNKYKRGSKRGDIFVPHVFPARVIVKLGGPNKDSLTFRGGFASGGTSPATLGKVRFAFGDQFDQTIDGALFKKAKSGATYTYKSSVGGTKFSITVDYQRDSVSVVASKIELGPLDGATTDVVFDPGDGQGAYRNVIRLSKDAKGVHRNY